MIEIIKNPNPKKPPKWRAVCKKCGCEFSYQEEDRSSDWNGVLGPGSYGGDHVFCPNCGERVWASMRDKDLITEENEKTS